MFSFSLTFSAALQDFRGFLLKRRPVSAQNGPQRAVNETQYIWELQTKDTERAADSGSSSLQEMSFHSHFGNIKEPEEDRVCETEAKIGR